MRFLKIYFRNLLVMSLGIGAMAIFAKVFYPQVLSFVPLVGQVYSGLNLWPGIILLLLLVPIPRGKY